MSCGYLGVFIILVAGAVIELVIDNTRIRNVLFEILFFIVACMAIFRFAQGTDYYGYRFNYYATVRYSFKEIISRSGWIWNRSLHGTMVWVLINKLLCPVIDFEYFFAALSAISFWCVRRFVVSFFDRGRVLALLLLFPVFILTYMFSGVRQGMASAIFLGVVLERYAEKHFKSALFWLFVCTLVHPISIFGGIIFILDRIPVKVCWGIVAVSALISPILYLLPSSVLESLPRGISYYTDSMSLNVFALVLRVVILCVVSWCYFVLNGDNDAPYLRYYKMVLINSAIYFALVSSSFLASRSYDFMRYVDLILVVDAIYKLRNGIKKYICVGCLVMYMLLLYVKNINAYISQGKYTNTNWISYPYLSVFDKEKANEIRPDVEYGSKLVFSDGKIVGVTDSPNRIRR